MKYFTSLFAIILLWSCSQETNSSEESVINLTLLNGDHKTVYLVAQIEEDFDTIYTTPLENGSAVLPYTVKYPELMYLNFDGAARPVQLFVDEDGLDVEIDFINVPPAKVTGSEYHQQLDEFFEIEMSFNTAMQGLQSLRMHAQTDQVVAELLKHKEDSIYANFKNATVNFCKTNGLVGAFVANRRIFDMSYEQGDSIYQNILAEHRGSSEVGTLKEKIEVLKKTRLGEAYTDIAQTNLVGEDLKLEEVIKENEYTLIQFWASWHRPSRINNIALKEVYDQFKTKGFEVYAVSLDEEKSNWIEAIETDSLGWIQVSSLNGVENQAAKNYGVYYLPQSILINKYGIIEVKNMDPEDLEEYLKEKL